jgi:transcriptional regulator with XRE-family HTH domain
MSVSEQLKILCVKLGISVSELGRISGKSPQAFSQKMKRESFTVDELKQIAETAGCRYEGAFIMPSGEKVTF